MKSNLTIDPQAQQGEWNPQLHQLQTITLPYPCVNQSSHSMYTVQIFFVDKQSGKRHSKTFNLGTQQDFVHNGNQQLRKRRIQHMGNLRNPLSKNYWRMMLMNKHPTIKDGYMEFLDYFVKKPRKQKKIKKPPVQKKKIINDGLPFI